MTIRALCRLYGRLPHEILALTPEQLGLALECMAAGEAHDQRMISRQKPGSVQGVVVLG